MFSQSKFYLPQDRAYVLFYFSCVCLRIVVSNTCCVVFLLCFLFVLCTQCCQFLWIVHFFIAPSVFSNVYLMTYDTRYWTIKSTPSFRYPSHSKYDFVIADLCQERYSFKYKKSMLIKCGERYFIYIMTNTRYIRWDDNDDLDVLFQNA